MTGTRVEQALKFAARGFRVFPQTRGKTPPAGFTDWQARATTDPEKIRAWNKQYPTCNFAVVAGPESGILGLDVDIKGRDRGEDGERTLSELGAKLGALPPTLTHRTGSGGRHLIFRHPGGMVPNCILGPGLELKAGNVALTLPGATYRDGREYTLLEDREPAELPAAWLALARNGKRPAPATAKIGERIEEGARNLQLTSLAGTLRNRGITDEALAAALLALNATTCNPPLPEAEVRGIAASISKAAGTDYLLTERWTDAGLADRILARHREMLRYCQTWRAWVGWNRTHWKIDDLRGAQRLAQETLTAVYTAALAIPDHKERAEIMKLAAKVEKTRAMENALAWLSAYQGVAVKPSTFDADPLLLNLQNGTIELLPDGNHHFREHRREDMLTKICNVSYDSEATCPLWDSFLQRITDGNHALHDFLRAAMGYTICGDASEQKLFMPHGLGANGKSVFLETLAWLLGNYAVKTPGETLLLNRIDAGQATPDLVRMDGARLVYAIETERGRLLAEAKIKELVGGDTITARRLYADPQEFRPKFSLWLSVNHLPHVQGQDHALWRRILEVPFTVTIPEAEQDKHLGEKLKAEGAGILNWALAGYLVWRMHGLPVPPEVLKATRQYRSKMDVLADFLAETKHDPTAEIRSSDLYTAYEAWCERNGEKRPTHRTLSEMLSERGFRREHHRTGWYWQGLRLLGEAEDPDKEAAA